ncbi:uncharacterized protein [Oryctolagus cuniculus]|uniref:uncharacterized protein isoform X1 n=1 Tax=Oryctolagus cuniculus TaxID=9986 RepID=UPI003879CD2A
MAMAMAMAAGNAAYFQRGSVFWLAVITLSFGYYTVGATELGQPPGASAPVTQASASFGGEAAQAQFSLSRLPAGREARTRKEAQAQSAAKAFGRCWRPCETGWPTFLSGLSSGRRASLMRALGSWARSLSTWWTIITPSCTTGIGLPG